MIGPVLFVVFCYKVSNRSSVPVNQHLPTDLDK